MPVHRTPNSVVRHRHQHKSTQRLDLIYEPKIYKFVLLDTH